MKSHWIAIILIAALLSSLFNDRTAKGFPTNLTQAYQPAATVAQPEYLSWRIDLSSNVEPAQAILKAASAASIEFYTQNGLTLSGKQPEHKMIPHLVLYRNGKLTERAERTMLLEISNLIVPAQGITLTVEIETQHPDPDLGSGSREKIKLMKRVERLQGDNGSINQATTTVISHTFGAVVASLDGEVTTPTDYLRLTMRLTDTDHPEGDPLLEHVEDYAVLLESQWVLPLSGLSEASPGAAPKELVIYFCNMFPFQLDEKDQRSRLTRDGIDRFISDDLSRRLAQAVYEQTNDWGFPWYLEWTSYRDGANAERLSVALIQPGVWYHGMAPGSAHSAISINTRHKDYAAYENLADAILGVFHHELFHNLQRNISQRFGGDGNIDADSRAVAFITEGMAILATSVGNSEIEFSGERSYLTQANHFLRGDRYQEDYLKAGYDGINPYRAALFWRFLYETCGGIVSGAENPAAGMQIIRHTLETLYSLDRQTEVLNARVSQLLPVLMDKALHNSQMCPFESYQEALALFAHHVFAIHLENGGCEKGESSTACGLFDPQDLYEAPAMVSLEYDGEQQVYRSELAASFGMEFIDIDIQSEVETLTIEFAPTSETHAEFRVQILNLYGEEIRDETVVLASEPLEIGLKPGEFASSQLSQDEDELDNHLAIIVTRVDTSELNSYPGEYSVLVR